MFSVYSITYLNGGVIISAPGHFIADDESEVWVELKNDNNNEIKADLMQYTGLKDKNGKEIYEGDIVRIHKFTQELGENMGVIEGEKEFLAKIEFSMYGGIYLNSRENDSCPLWEYENGFHEESIEVIGNIHENPELLNN